MSAPKYSSSNYDSAAAKYQQLADQYAGSDNYTKYAQQAAKTAGAEAQSAATQAGASAKSNALNAGYSRAKAARAGQNATASQFNTSYNSSYNNAYNNAYNAATNAKNAQLNAYGSLLNGAQQKDANKYTSDSNRYGAAMGAVGGVFTGAANALSDGTQKEISAKTDVQKRRKELLSRLRG